MSEQDTTTDDAETATDDQQDLAQDGQEAPQGDQNGQGDSKGNKGGSDALRSDLVRERRQRQALEKELQRLKDRDLSELQRAQKQAQEAQDRAEKAERAALRQQAAIKYQLTPDLAKRLQGDTEDDLDADAAELAKLITPKAPRPDPSQGSRGGNAPRNMNDLIRSAVRR